MTDRLKDRRDKSATAREHIMLTTDIKLLKVSFMYHFCFVRPAIV